MFDSEMLNSIWTYKLFVFGENRAIEVNQIVLAMLVMLVGLMLSSLVSRIIGGRLKARNVSATAAAIAQKVIFYILLITCFFTVLRVLELPLTMFAFLGGAIAIGVGFGTQNILNNFISGWILMAERPVRLGDLVDVDGHLGRVETIGARSTRIRRTDGIEMLVPNSAMLERIVTNWTLMDRNIRTTVRVGIRYGSPTEEAAALIAQAVNEHPGVLREPKPIVVFEDFGDNALIFDVYFWCNVNSEMELRLVKSDLRFRIDAMFRKADIVIAYPQRDIHMDTERPLEVRMLPAAPSGEKEEAHGS